MSVQKTKTMGELLETGMGLFFPNGHSAKGPVDDFKFDIGDFGHNTVPLESTVNQLYEQTKQKMMRIYTCSRAKDRDVSKEASIILSDLQTLSPQRTGEKR
ncbi:hypothetical protein NHX12_030739 [Muraenolepis orangiensis]|uniref:Uncharacterized protein n=1 Tax=Muraenolepis orangiensis TaxID=630683 RepID=A0A9Q0ILX7_9TELE|nr:hypothetical protein NHX12_030739 [Muraenolepis orangiensis]